MDNNLVNEHWRVINDFPMYEVSDQGNIRNIKTGRILKPKSNRGDYLMVCLREDGKQFMKLVHRLVGQAFIPNNDNLPCIDHINGVKTDNRASNLRWCTHKQNMLFDNHIGHCSEKEKNRLRKKYYKNRESILEQQKKYHQDNKEQLSEYQKLYYQAHKEQMLEYQKQWREAHKEQLSEYRKQYYQKNKSRKD